ncbi:hypothetical protein D3C79_907640 [compost metagenome]
MQLVGHGRTADDQCQGQHDLDLVLLDALDHAIGDVAHQAAEHDAANGFAGEQDRGVSHRWCFAELGDAQQHGEHHNGGTVVEQRLTDDGGLQWLGSIGST